MIKTYEDQPLTKVLYGKPEPRSIVIDLKTDRVPFEDILYNNKLVEIRLNDKPYVVGAVLNLMETKYTSGEMHHEGKPLEFTGRTVKRRIVHIQKGYGLKENHVALSLENL